MPQPYVRLRETTFDLYVERNALPAHYKFLSTISSWVILAGYILFAIAFSSRDEDLNSSRNLITAVASALLIAGYVGILVVALLSKSLLFLIDGVILQTLTASLLGLFTTLANFALRPRLPTSQIYMSIPLVTACVTTVVAAIILAVAYRELKKIRRQDERRNLHIQLGPYMGSNPNQPAIIGIPGQDDEAQRRQLLRLLQERQEGMIQQQEVNNTFKIDLPGESQYNRRANGIQDARQPYSNRGGFGLASLIPWRNNRQVNFDNARERRREEIERSSISNLGEVWRAHDPGQHQNIQPPAWGWPPATRYA